MRTGRLVSPGLTLGFAPGVESVKERYGKEGQGVVHKEGDRMMGLEAILKWILRLGCGLLLSLGL